jgi:hypothetical protein
LPANPFEPAGQARSPWNKFHIPTVGTGIYFIDTEGNVAGAMQYEKPAAG